MKRPGIKVFAPATISNLAVGFDIIGFAIDAPGDEVVVRFGDSKGLKITHITGDDGKLPKTIEKNTAGVAAAALLRHLGETDRSIEMEIHKRMPFGSGLGSSAASAVAGVLSVNELLGNPLSKRELLPFAIEGELIASKSIHADNVAPCLLGGIIFIRDNESLDVHRIAAPRGLYACVVHPKIEILTSEARGILSDTISLKQHILQSGNLGALVLGLQTSNFDLIRSSLRDVIIEPQRAKLIPHFYEIQEAALVQGALGCSISGAGPSIFALCKNTLELEAVSTAMQAVFTKHGIESTVYNSPINLEGAKKC